MSALLKLITDIREPIKDIIGVPTEISKSDEVYELLKDFDDMIHTVSIGEETIYFVLKMDIRPLTMNSIRANAKPLCLNCIACTSRICFLATSLSNQSELLPLASDITDHPNLNEIRKFRNDIFNFDYKRYY
jgi:hypothetical protein